ncbi:MAG TPA: hypothetical protein VHB68_17195 [Steroidobacteraceae bacterium]|nr:hypothetical protein [Steroidobacteraceae bacterium]
MDTKIAQAARQAGIPATQRLDTEERVSAFLAQGRVAVALYQAGRHRSRKARR